MHVSPLSSLFVLQDPWCRFDIVVVAVSIIGVGIDLGTPSNLQFLPLLRVLRVVRIFRLVPKAEGLKVLLRTLFMSLPGACRVGESVLARRAYRVLCCFCWLRVEQRSCCGSGVFVRN